MFLRMLLGLYDMPGRLSGELQTPAMLNLPQHESGTGSTGTFSS
jgi:hypothetical protein